MNRTEICGGINLTSLQNQRFKTSALSVNFVVPLRSETASCYGLIPYVLKRGSSEHGSMEEITRALGELYGATIDPYVRKKGEKQIISFVSTFVDSKYLPAGGDDQLGSVAALLFELLLSPDLESGSFVRESLKSECFNQIDRINAENDDKREYARRRLIESMCAGEPFSIHRLGNVSNIDGMTSRSLYSRYLSFIQNAGVEIFYSGPKDAGEVRDTIGRLCSLEARRPEIVSDIVKGSAGQVTEVSERMAITQDKLVLGFRTGLTSSDAGYPAMMLLNAVFGGSVSSKLFMNVREKLSLCYYASSYVDPRKGILVVDSGVNAGGVEPARAEILKQLEECKNGPISADELESARLTVVNSLKSLADSLYFTEDYWLSQAVAGTMKEPAQIIKEIEALGVDDVSDAARRVVLDTVYHLAGNEVTGV